MFRKRNWSQWRGELVVPLVRVVKTVGRRRRNRDEQITTPCRSPYVPATAAPGPRDLPRTPAWSACTAIKSCRRPAPRLTGVNATSLIRNSPLTTRTPVLHLRRSGHYSAHARPHGSLGVPAQMLYPRALAPAPVQRPPVLWRQLERQALALARRQLKSYLASPPDVGEDGLREDSAKEQYLAARLV